MPSLRRRLTMGLPLTLLSSLLLTLPVAAEGGLKAAPGDDPWPRWQARVLGSASFSLWQHVHRENIEAALPRQHALSLLGDYYFSTRPRSQPAASGLRATSGLILGSPSSRALSGFGAERRLGAAASIAGLGDSRAIAPGFETVPYLGIGYTSIGARTGWAFSADIGLIARHAGSAAKFGRVVSGAQSLDDLLREMRLAPLANVGVSYSF